MLVGISIPYLCLVCHIQVFKAATMAFLLLRVGTTHQSNAGSLSIPLDMAYSAISIGYDSFMSNSFIHVSFSSFHHTRSHPPAVVLCRHRHPWRLYTHLSVFETARAQSTLWYTMPSISLNVNPSESTCASMFSVMTFAEYSHTCPLSNLTSYRTEL